MWPSKSDEQKFAEQNNWQETIQHFGDRDEAASFVLEFESEYSSWAVREARAADEKRRHGF